MAHLLFFGQFSDIAENGDVALPAHVNNTDKLIVWLGETNERFTSLWNKSGTAIVVNNEIIRESQPIKTTDEIAILSALSGG